MDKEKTSTTLDLLEVGSKIQRLYSEIESYYSNIREADPNCLDCQSNNYDYACLCELLMQKIQEEFPFVKIDFGN